MSGQLLDCRYLFHRISLVLIACYLLVACGGGSSGGAFPASDSRVTQQSEPDPTPNPETDDPETENTETPEPITIHSTAWG